MKGDFENQASFSAAWEYCAVVRQKKMG